MSVMSGRMDVMSVVGVVSMMSVLSVVRVRGLARVSCYLHF